MRRTRLTLLVLSLCLVLGGTGTDALGASKATQPRALVFFNAYCEACKKDAARISAWADHEQRRMHIVGIGFMMSAADSTQFAQLMGWRFSVDGDPAGKLADRYHVHTPTVIVEINRKRTRLINYALPSALR